MSNNPVVKIALNSLLGVVLIFVWTRFVNISEILQIISRVEIKYLLGFFLVFVISAILRGLRLKILLSKFHIPLKDVTMLTFLSQFLSFIIPIRAGEISKSVYLSTQFELPLGKSLVWIFIDRFFDFWILLLVITTLFLIVPTGLSLSLVQAVLGIFIVFSLVVIFLVNRPQIAKRLVKIMSALFIVSSIKKHFVSFLETIIDGFEILKLSTAKLILVAGVTLLAAINDGLVWFLVFKSLAVDFSFPQGILANSLSAFTFLIPAAPGYVGSAEAAGLVILSGVFGMPPNTASAGTVVFHLLTMVGVLVFGVISLYFLKFDIRLVWHKLKGKE